MLQIPCFLTSQRNTQGHAALKAGEETLTQLQEKDFWQVYKGDLESERERFRENRLIQDRWRTWRKSLTPSLEPRKASEIRKEPCYRGEYFTKVYQVILFIRLTLLPIDGCNSGSSPSLKSSWWHQREMSMVEAVEVSGTSSHRLHIFSVWELSSDPISITYCRPGVIFTAFRAWKPSTYLP